MAPARPVRRRAGADRPGAALGYRGELEFAGETWLRARVYDPSTRSFLSPDPLPPVPGTAYAANTYHYAGNDPLGKSDPLGVRPVTDQELREIRDRMGSNFISRNKDWIIAGALIVGGIAVMATGFGGPLGAAMIGGALLSAGSSAAIQKVTTGEVNYKEVAVAGLVGGAAGGARLRRRRARQRRLEGGGRRARRAGRRRRELRRRRAPTAASTAATRSTRPAWPRTSSWAAAIGGVGGRLGRNKPEVSTAA